MSFANSIHVVGADTALRQTLNKLATKLQTIVCVHNSVEDFERSTGEGCLVCLHDSDGPDLPDVQRRLNVNGQLAVVYLVRTAHLADIVAVMQHGAVTVLEYPVDMHPLSQAVHRATTRSSNYQRLVGPTCDAARRLIRLDSDEYTLLSMFRSGLSNKEAAARLDVSSRTIENRRRKIARKLNVGSITEAVTLMTRAEYAGLFGNPINVTSSPE